MFIRLILISLGVSADSFAVSIGKGLTVRKLEVRHHWLVGLWFGGFQALFPLIGYFAASLLEDYVTAVDHWIIMGLLGIIGINMIREAVFEPDEEEGAEQGQAGREETDSEETGSKAIAYKEDQPATQAKEPFSWRNMLPLSIATSIDAFGVGASLALMDVNIWLAVLVIGTVTALASVLGLRIGNLFGARWCKPAQIAGGIILIAMGVQIFMEHLGILP